ncbi:translesion DNA synthesis-associated protein ImuA [Paraburkholderia unamae]|uniref:Protein ImuA n=1 Tax=Paraburkholderia unamae TaxID=219649 RepID=A0ABX5KPP8_9BURK|nr:translesion DNA synthesis-associated protein ImuA [Paraburkholderia unamae]PVX83633.1 protein ImuA [Paraburkholderia unamae]RAR63780.1 protein ImuA [Paraburkholderia unamae]
MALPLAQIEDIHPDLWRASQLASARARTVASGYEALDAELPGHGWPTGSLSEILLQQPGCGELRLLKSALGAATKRSVMLLQPPHTLQPTAFSWWGLNVENIRVLSPSSNADALWAAEQILRAGTVGTLLFWQQHIRPEALRRLQLSAQRSETLFFLFRPIAAASSTSPAPLRIALEAVKGGLNISFVKRRGPHRDQPVFVPLSPSPVLLNRNAPLDRRSSAAPAHRELLPDVAHASA